MPRHLLPSLPRTTAPFLPVVVLSSLLTACSAGGAEGDTPDPVRVLQTEAIRNNRSPLGHWGPQPDNYTAWGTHSNRLIPVYTFGTRGGPRGVDLETYIGANSVYRRETDLRKIYGYLPTNSVHPAADALDQTQLAALQRAALAAGKKHIILMIFDGMDWQSTRNAAIYYTGRVAYTSGRGTGLHFLDYTAGETTQFGAMVTSPHNEGTRVDVSTQKVTSTQGVLFGGYNWLKGGAAPWTPGCDNLYLIAKSSAGLLEKGEHAYPDSAATATAMCSGIKSYNDTINVDVTGNQNLTVAHEAQALGYAVGAISSVPTSHATPAAAYAHNVHRDDYQDISRDQLGLKSVSHPGTPLPGLDVVLGGGHGVILKKDKAQGTNFVPGNKYLADGDLAAVDVKNGGRYVVAQRTAGIAGGAALAEAARTAASSGKRLLGFYGVGASNGHLPYATANGDYSPAPGRSPVPENYTPADLQENPTLADMTSAALTVLSRNPKGFWLMVEAGDVDWANHDNNLDNSIGAVRSGDLAFKVITDWVEKQSNWQETVVILTADHGHYFFLENPEMLAAAGRKAGNLPGKPGK